MSGGIVSRRSCVVRRFSTGSESKWWVRRSTAFHVCVPGTMQCGTTSFEWRARSNSDQGSLLAVSAPPSCSWRDTWRVPSAVLRWALRSDGWVVPSCQSRQASRKVCRIIPASPRQCQRRKSCQSRAREARMLCTEQTSEPPSK